MENDFDNIFDNNNQIKSYTTKRIAKKVWICDSSGIDRFYKQLSQEGYQRVEGNGGIVTWSIKCS